LESKLQRIENLDKAVEHLMRRVEALDSRVNDNIDKTDAVITKLRTLDLKLFNAYPSIPVEVATRITESKSGSHTEDSKYVIHIFTKFILYIWLFNRSRFLFPLMTHKKKKIVSGCFKIFIKKYIYICIYFFFLIYSGVYAREMNQVSY